MAPALIAEVLLAGLGLQGLSHRCHPRVPYFLLNRARGCLLEAGPASAQAFRGDWPKGNIG